jgi:hypothetical protein
MHRAGTVSRDELIEVPGTDREFSREPPVESALATATRALELAPSGGERWSAAAIEGGRKELEQDVRALTARFLSYGRCRTMSLVRFRRWLKFGAR